MKYDLVPLELKEAQAFVNAHHRHNVAPHRAIPDGAKDDLGDSMKESDDDDR